MENKFQQFDMPVYYTMGNHEIVGVLAESGMDVSHPLFGKVMYEKLYGKSYKSFTFSGWKYFLLDGIKIMEEERNYPFSTGESKSHTKFWFSGSIP
jgi:hypothetical protein